MNKKIIATLCVPLLCGNLLHAADVSFDTTTDGTITACIGDQPVANYVYAKGKIARPYVCNVRTTDGIQVSRNYPPLEGKDRTDHTLIHPGVWMSFKEIGGLNFWRKGNHCFTTLVEKPSVKDGVGGFTVENLYCEGDDKDKARVKEICRIKFLAIEGGWLLLWDSAFTGLVKGAIFGDQEEMGLGIRVESEISGTRGGKIFNSNGQCREREVWGKQADWCDYAGRMRGRWAGMTILTGKNNFRKCWFHARDYGLLLANPFGRKAFHAGERSQVDIPCDGALRLQFGVYVHSAKNEKDTDINKIYQEFLKLMKK